MKRREEEEAEWGKVNEQRKIDGKEEQTLEDWRKEKKGERRRGLALPPSLPRFEPLGVGVGRGRGCKVVVSLLPAFSLPSRGETRDEPKQGG